MSSIALELVRHRRGALVDLPFGQVDVFAALCRTVAELGCESATHRQMNAITAAADLIYDALAHADVPATPGMGLRAWSECDDTGASSKYLAAVLMFGTKWWLRAVGQPDPGRPHPHDAGDFGRCVKMIDAQPELRDNLARLAQPAHGPVWNAIGARWAELEALYRANRPLALTAELKALAAKAVAA